MENDSKDGLFRDMIDNTKSPVQKFDIPYHAETDENIKNACEEIITSDGLI